MSRRLNGMNPARYSALVIVTMVMVALCAATFYLDTSVGVRRMALALTAIALVRVILVQISRRRHAGVS